MKLHADTLQRHSLVWLWRSTNNSAIPTLVFSLLYLKYFWKVLLAKCLVNQVYLCYFWPSSQLCCPSLPTFQSCLSVRHLVVPKRGLEWVVVTRQASGPDHTPIHTDPSRENKTMLGYLFQQLSEWLTVSPSLLQIQQMPLSVSICTVTQKDNSSVCAWGDYAFHCFF